MSSTPPDDGLNAWRLRELVWSLRWLAADPDAAIAAQDGIVTADEIALDVNHWYEVARDRGLLDDLTARAIKAIDDEFSAMSAGQASIWTNEAIRQSPRWTTQLARARNVLSLLGESRADADLSRPRDGGPTYIRAQRPPEPE